MARRARVTALDTTPSRWRSYVVLACIVLAGEAIFSLPFHVPRFFRPTVLQTLGLTNAALGDAFAVYGLTAMASYLPGGWLADRWSARRLLSASLLATAGGGFYFATLPSIQGLTWLYAYWGATTILLFWAAMIRATRDWGGALRQGQAFGVLEGGRGLVAAASASIAVGVLAQALGGATDLTALRADALRAVIYFYTAVTLLAALLCWWFIPDAAPSRASASAKGEAWWRGWGDVSLWLQAGVVVAAYCGYKGLDNYALYAVSAFGLDEVAAAAFLAKAAWLRPVAALAAGLLADRVRPSLTLVGIFLLAAASVAVLAGTAPSPMLRGVLMANVLLSVAAVYALRGVYFTLMEESGVPSSRTGAAVGLVSVVGFTPDVFFAPIAGRLLDAHPGVVGQQQYFALLTGIALVGAVLATALALRLRPSRLTPPVGGTL